MLQQFQVYREVTQFRVHFVVVQSFSHVWLFYSPMGWYFSRQEYWSGLPFPSPEDLPDPGMEPGSPTLQADSLPPSHQGSPHTYIHIYLFFQILFPYSSFGKESACNVGDPGLIPGLGRSPGEGNGNPSQYSCLENPMDREAWQATVHGVERVGHDLATKSPPPIFTLSRELHSLPFLSGNSPAE